MHPTAMRNCQSFFTTYSASFVQHQHVKVVESGSQNVNGTLRDTCPANFEYIGVDFAQAKGVDIVLADPYKLPFEDESVDVVLSSSCFEQSEMFWLVFLEILRVLKPNGLFYLNVPSTGSFHRYPVDCWRFYPDSGAALVKWAQLHGSKPERSVKDEPEHGGYAEHRAARRRLEGRHHGHLGLERISQCVADISTILSGGVLPQSRGM